MGLTDMYLMTTKNLEDFLNALLSAQTPDKFTQKFLESLGFGSSNDRLFIKMLKELNFLDASGIPTERYSQFLDQSQSKVVLAEAIKEAYSDIFQTNVKAYDFSVDEAKNKLRTLTGGKKSDKVYLLMANTFVGLCALADFTTPASTIQPTESKASEAKAEFVEEDVPTAHLAKPMSLHYNIQIILPDTRDQKVYEAIFSSLRKHLA